MAECLSEILCISRSEEKIHQAAWYSSGETRGSLSKMDLAIMGGMKEHFTPCLILYGRGMPSTF